LTEIDKLNTVHSKNGDELHLHSVADSIFKTIEGNDILSGGYSLVGVFANCISIRGLLWRRRKNLNIRLSGEVPLDRSIRQ
jgi:hypothetical protein